MKRYLSIWFPMWPITRLKHMRHNQNTSGGGISSDDAPDPPFVLVEAGPKGLRVAAANPAACENGISVGLRFTDAKARCPQLLSEDINRLEDARALHALANWMTRVSPIVSIDGDDGLMIDATGCGHLHGGEESLAKEVFQSLQRKGILCRIGIAGTPGASSVIAHSTNTWDTIQPGFERDGLADKSVTTLRLSEEAETLLRRFGINKIGQLYEIDRKSLARRFQSADLADAVHLRLDQALGIIPELLQPVRVPARYYTRLQCPEPISTTEAIAYGLEKLVGQICETLSEYGLGGRHFALRGYCSDGSVSDISVRTARAVRSKTHILRLFAEKLDHINPSFGIDCMVLEAHRIAPIAMGDVSFDPSFSNDAYDPSAIAALSDKIVAKLGDGSVRVTAYSAAHLPEKAERTVCFEGELPDCLAPPLRQGQRPLRLFEHPEPVEVLAGVPDGPPQRFTWRRVARHVARADGPERIAPDWWTHMSTPQPVSAPNGAEQNWLAPKLDPRADAKLIQKIRTELATVKTSDCSEKLPRTRDYYRLEDTSGRRYWVFRDGLYGDGRGDPPQWYIHGLFA